jgi:hypothetical protein
MKMKKMSKGFKCTLRCLSLIVLSGVAVCVALAAQSVAAPAPHLRVHLLDPSFDPNTVGGVPFCTSASHGTILCYPPSFLKTAYDFPPTTGTGGLDGTGQTIVIVDAFGSPTIQSDLDAFGCRQQPSRSCAGQPGRAFPETCPVTSVKKAALNQSFLRSALR